MLDAAAQREETFEAAGDVGLDLLRRHARIERRYDHYGDVHRREHIDGHARQAADAHYRDDQADDDDEVRVLNGKPGHLFVLQGGHGGDLGLDLLAWLQRGPG